MTASKAAIELAGRVVTEEIIGAQVGRHAPQTEGEIAGGRDRNAISLFGHHVKRRAALGEARSFLLHSSIGFCPTPATGTMSSSNGTMPRGSMG